MLGITCLPIEDASPGALVLILFTYRKLQHLGTPLTSSHLISSRPSFELCIHHCLHASKMTSSACRTLRRSSLLQSIPLRSFQCRRLKSTVAFDWEDPLASKSLFSEEETGIQETARAYCQEKLLPRILGKCRFTCVRGMSYLPSVDL